MEKKEYITPEIEVVDLDLPQMLAASSIEVNPGESGTEQLSNRRRGTWGNLWTDNEKE